MRPWLTVVAALTMAGVMLAWRFFTFVGFPNDHYVHLARAQQLLLGEWPVKDFADPGMPLMYAASAAARLIGGRAMGVEFTLVAGAFALAAALIVVAAARLSGSRLIGMFVATLAVLANPRAYGYPKLLLYAAFAALACRAASCLGAWRIPALAALTVVSFLFRHDHGLFVGIGAAVFIAVEHAPAGLATVVRREALLAALVGVLLAPWAIFVSATAGLVPYVTAGVAFSREEARANVLEKLPTLTWGVARWTPEDSVAALFYLFHALPVMCIAVLAWQWRYGHASRPGEKRGERWRGETSVVMALAVLAIPLNLSFLRDPLSVRVPDAIVPAALLGAWLLGLACAGPWRPRRVGVAVAAVALALSSARAVAAAADVPEQWDRAELGRGSQAAWARAQELRARFAKAVPEGDQVPSRQADALMPFMAFLQRCTGVEERVLVTSLRPEVYVIANRGFAGGQVGYLGGFYGSDADQALTVARLRRQSVPFVVRVLDVEADLAQTMPQVVRYLDDHYAPVANIDVRETTGVRLDLERGRETTLTDQQTGLPCLPRKAGG